MTLSEISVNPWLRLQGVGDRGRKCATYGTLPCNLKARLVDSFSKQPTGQKNDAEQDVNAVIGRAKRQGGSKGSEHAILPGAKCDSQNTERKVNDTENKGKGLCSGQSSRKAEIKCEGAGD